MIIVMVEYPGPRRELVEVDALTPREAAGQAHELEPGGTVAAVFTAADPADWLEPRPVKPGLRFEHKRQIIGSPAGGMRPARATVTRVAGNIVYYRTESEAKRYCPRDNFLAIVRRWLRDDELGPDEINTLIWLNEVTESHGVIAPLSPPMRRAKARLIELGLVSEFGVTYGINDAGQKALAELDPRRR